MTVKPKLHISSALTMCSLAAHPPAFGAPAKTCPVTTMSHEHGYQPPREGDLRSVCPALNTMANHGYISRDGKDISPYMVYSGLMACYGLSSPLAVLLTVGGWLLVERYFGQRLNLFEIGLHNGVEHDASVVHLDCPPGQKNAPIEIQPELVADFAAHVVERAREDSCSMEVEERDVFVTERDIALTRVRRERLSEPLSAMHAEMARGEMAIILGVWHQRVDGAEGAPLQWLRTWLAEERLPSGWKPDHVNTLMDVMHRASAIRKEMNRIREEERKVDSTRRKRRRGVLDIVVYFCGLVYDYLVRYLV
ncbi:Chloroperoxidase [Mycena pura]|uniref:Chloroperoxidase n=1 Tax=Mycena pura TaxID=153505 RepID=A0AAD6Y090_9AGAR|nr:Chloroperoxidase [Mycena pura]